MAEAAAKPLSSPLFSAPPPRCSRRLPPVVLDALGQPVSKSAQYVRNAISALVDGGQNRAVVKGDGKKLIAARRAWSA